MKKNLLFVILMSLGLIMPSCRGSLNPEDASKAILEGERARIPLYIQEYELLNLTIDSLCMLNTVEPMSGLLYTTWTYTETRQGFKNFEYIKEKNNITKPIIIQITNIQRSKENSNMIQWNNDWDWVNLQLDRTIYEL